MKTPFYEIHKALGAKIVNFHGWEMPLLYSGIVDEHINVRTSVGLFDVSHMGRFKIRGSTAYGCIQNLLTNDVSKLRDRQAVYSPMCNESGGIVDDIIAFRINMEDFLVVCNASNREKDLEWIVEHSQLAAVENVSDRIALLALQGPLAQHTLQKVVALDLDQLRPFEFAFAKIFGTECMISRTGYTGEDGFELFFDASKVEIWNRLMDAGSQFTIKPAGLGARDTLRLEAGLMLYGNDIDENTTPLEVPLKWAVKFEKDFIGKRALMNMQVTRKLVGFEVLEKRIPRRGNEVMVNGLKVGFVTSGSFSPTLKKPIGFCFVPIQVQIGQSIEVDIGGKLYKAKVTSTRFYRRK
ncbi:MAG: glycine cleavage system aminomethyltransferase GcvT [Nitrososphaerales archaeon]